MVVIVWLILVAIAVIAIPTVLAVLVVRTERYPQGTFDDIIKVDCEGCEGYGFLMMDGSIVPRELRRSVHYSPSLGGAHPLAHVTKTCMMCHGQGTYLTDKE